jgi:tRNA threonylcarbamoyladenosine biosynthesis protein TsaB
LSIILHIESSGPICSVALTRDSEIIAYRECTDDRSHGYMLAPFIDEMLKEKELNPSMLNAVCVSKGPGSYTGLRIGVSTAKGMSWALDIPLIGINTLYSMAQGFLLENAKYRDSEYLLCPMIDARRMEVYSCLYSTDLAEQSEIKAEIIDIESYRKELEKKRIVFFGDGALKCKEAIDHPNAIFFENFLPTAKFLVIPGLKAFLEGNFENNAYFEPFYLKDFVATIPRNKMT